jgi:hypothetical protein
VTLAYCSICDAFVVLEDAVTTETPGEGYRCSGCREDLPADTVAPDATVSPSLGTRVHPTSWG